MRFVFYTHSLVSDWNHGNAHFLRGVMRALNALGHSTLALEPAGGWSRQNLHAQAGKEAVEAFERTFPDLSHLAYGPEFEHESALAAADVVVVHEWTEPNLVARIGAARRNQRFCLLFHDTHHRAVSAEEEIATMPLGDYDGVLAFGASLRERYLEAGWGSQVITWHEAADVSLFSPRPEIEPEEDIVWVGNWGDGERADELRTFLLEPAAALGLKGGVHGVRYPADALEAWRQSGLAYRGWIANADVPEAFARARATVHVPRRPYVSALPGIPTIRMFEAMACGIPLLVAPWHDAEGLFRPGCDYLSVADGEAMQRGLRDVLSDPDLAWSLATSGRETILARHTCDHRALELLEHVRRLGPTLSKDAAA
jgi:spore maturation protein CgeB